MYRNESPEAEVLRLRDELKATKQDLNSVQADRDKFKQRLWVLSTVILGGIPPALVLRYHVPSRILLLDVLGFAIWGWLLLRVVRRRS